MRLLLFPLILLFLLASCHKKPVACIDSDIPDKIFVLDGAEVSNCSENTDYFVWTFKDSSMSELDNPLVPLNIEGDQTITLNCYSGDGRRKDVAKVHFFAGYIYVDSIVITSLTNDFYSSAFDNDSVQNLKLKYHGVPSIETYNNPVQQNLPLTFTFSETIKLDRKKVKYLLYEKFDSSEDGILLSINSLPHDTTISPHTLTSSGYGLKSAIYWHFKK